MGLGINDGRWLGAENLQKRSPGTITGFQVEYTNATRSGKRTAHLPKYPPSSDQFLRGRCPGFGIFVCVGLDGVIRQKKGPVLTQIELYRVAM